MVKFASKIVVLLIILMFIFSGLNHVFKEFNHFEKTMQEYEAEKGNVELAVFGSSHAFHSYDVRLLEVKLDRNSFNFGGVAQRFKTTEVVMDKIIKENDLELIIVDIFSMSIDEINSEGAKQLQLQTLDYLPLSFNKIRQANSIFGRDYLPYALFPFFRNHSEWNTVDELRVNRKYKIENNSEYYKGFKTVNQSFNDKTWKEFLNKYTFREKHAESSKLTKNQKNQINRIIDLANNNNISILFTNTPSYITDFNLNYLKTTSYIEEYLNRRNIPFINFDSMRIQNILNQKDFKDPNHLNALGAIKVTDSLIKYLSKNYSFESLRRNKQKFVKNKFYQINTNFEKSIKFRNTDENNSFEIQKMALFKSSCNRIELIIKTNLNKNVPLKLDIGLTKSQIKTLYLKDKMFIKNEKYFNWGKLNEFNSFSYNGKNYKSIQFYFPFDYIKNIKVFLGKNANIKILDKSNIEL